MEKKVKYNRIKEVLDAKGKNQAWLSDELDVRYLTVNNYCNNRRQPSIPMLFRIAKILKVHPGELLNG